MFLPFLNISHHPRNYLTASHRHNMLVEHILNKSTMLGLDRQAGRTDLEELVDGLLAKDVIASKDGRVGQPPDVILAPHAVVARGPQYVVVYALQVLYHMGVWPVPRDVVQPPMFGGM